MNRRAPKRRTVALFVALTAAPIAVAQGPQASATAALETFIAAWNAADNDALRETLHYPHLSLFGPGQLVVAEHPREFSTDFDRMREQEGWVRSDLRILGTPQVAPGQVHVEAEYRRYNAAGDVYRTGHVYYIVTKQDSRWGMQFRMPYTADSRDPLAAHRATETIDEFFQAWNKADNDAIRAVVNFPHAFVLPDGEVAVARRPDELYTDFKQMTAREGWRYSRYQDLRIPYADTEKALAHLTFTRHHEDNSVYRTVPVVWFLTRQNDRWGVQVRAILQPVSPD